MDGENIFPQVTSPAGTFKGSILKSFSGLSYAAFRGIPYAQPPIGPLRFERPQPFPPTEGVYDATKEGPNSIQPLGSDFLHPGQEDCLYLNVFLPMSLLGENTTSIQDRDSPDLKKVLVFIHGGGFLMGCANQHVPGDFVAQGDVIVVTMNYRLSWLGFVKGPVEEMKGNMGMWDLLMALKWVKDNIRLFGGDQDDITLAGQSMGGEMVSALSISPHGKGLFTKGLLMSGTMFSSLSVPGSSDHLLDKLAERLGLPVPQEGEHGRFFQSLKELPEERFILPYDKHFTCKFTSIDGDFFPKSIKEMQKDTDYLGQVGFYNRDYLVTLTNNEGQCLSQGPFISEGINDPDLKVQYKAFRRFMTEPTFYRSLEKYSQPDFESRWPLNDLCIDPIINLSAFEFLDASMSTANDKGQSKCGKSYFLWFDHFPTYYPPPIEGVPHSIDLCYLFDISPDEILKTYYACGTQKDFTEEDQRMKAEFITLITNFMKYGNPNGSTKSAGVSGKQWPEYDPENEYFLNFSKKPEVKQFPIKKRRNLWQDSIPQWNQESKDD